MDIKKFSQRLFPIYTKEILMALGILLIAFLLKGFIKEEPILLEEISRPEHFEEKEEKDIYISSEEHRLDHTKVSLSISPRVPSDSEIVDYLGEVEALYLNQLESLFNPSKGFLDSVELPKDFKGCKVDYDVLAARNITKEGWIDIAHLDKVSGKMNIKLPYTLEYKEKFIKGIYETTLDKNMFTQSYETNFIIYKVQEEWNLIEENPAMLNIELPKIDDIAYDTKEKPMGVMTFLKLFIVLCFLISLITHIEKKERAKILERQKRIQLTYFINNFVLMYQTGLTIQKSFKISIQNRLNTLTSHHLIYTSFESLNRLIEQDISIYKLVEAINNQFEIIECRRFTRLILQNLKQGDHYLSIQLTHLSEKMWDERIRRARKTSEKASSKLVLPMVLIFIIIIIITIVPTFLQVGSF